MLFKVCIFSIISFLFWSCEITDFEADDPEKVPVLNLLAVGDSSARADIFFSTAYNSLDVEKDTAATIKINQGGAITDLVFEEGKYTTEQMFTYGSTAKVEARLSNGQILKSEFRIPEKVQVEMIAFDTLAHTPSTYRDSSLKMTLRIKNTTSQRYWMAGGAFYIRVSVGGTTQVRPQGYYDFDEDAITFAEEPLRYFFDIPNDGNFHQVDLYFTPQIHSRDTVIGEILHLSDDLFYYYRYVEEFPQRAILSYFANIGETYTNIQGGAGICAGYNSYRFKGFDYYRKN